MNDTTNPITPEPKDAANDLLQNILAVLVKHIDARVESKVIEIMQSHATMALIDEKMEERLREIAADLVTEHEQDYEHNSTDDINDTVATYVNHYDHTNNIKQAVFEIISDGDYPTEERVSEMMDDLDLEEKVKDVLRNI